MTTAAASSRERASRGGAAVAEERKSLFLTSLCKNEEATTKSEPPSTLSHFRDDVARGLFLRACDSSCYGGVLRSLLFRSIQLRGDAQLSHPLRRGRVDQREKHRSDTNSLSSLEPSPQSPKKHSTLCPRRRLQLWPSPPLLGLLLPLRATTHGQRR